MNIRTTCRPGERADDDSLGLGPGRDSAFSNSLRCGKVKRPVSFPHHGCCTAYTDSLHPKAINTDKSYGHKSSHKPQPGTAHEELLLPVSPCTALQREKERKCHHGAFGLPTHRLAFYASPGASRPPTRHPPTHTLLGSPWQSLMYFCLHGLDLPTLYISHMKEAQYVVLCVWIFSLFLMFSGSIHVVTCINT